MAHAKFIIQEGVVKVNGEVEIRRGKKLRPGDIIEVEGKLQIIGSVKGVPILHTK